MSFINKKSAIIRRSNKDLFYIHLNNGVIVDYFDKDDNFIYSNYLNNHDLDFTNCHFSIDKQDNLYGIYDNSALYMIKCENQTTTFNESLILNYDCDKFNILYPSIKIIDDCIHIFYYVYNKECNCASALFHHYKKDDLWSENKIDFIDHLILDNYCITWSQNCPTIFYLNLVNGFEEIFFSRFNMVTLTWSSPVQITNSKKSKLYLSVLKDSMNFYHLSCCEYEDGGYRVKYMNGYLTDNNLNIDDESYITSPSVCMYPSFLKKRSEIHLMWIEYSKLCVSTSTNQGKKWSSTVIHENNSKDNFIRASFDSNYSEDIEYNVSSVFTVEETVGLLGF